MGFGFQLLTKSNDKIKRKYAKHIERDTNFLNQQLEELDTQLENKLIDKQTYERFKIILEVHSSRARNIKQYKKVLEKLNNNII